MFNTKLKLNSDFSWGGMGLLTILALLVSSVDVSAQVAADKIFPDSTKGIVIIRNLKDLSDQWKQTQIGTLTFDPIMKPFIEDLHSQLDGRMLDRFGLTMDGIEDLPSGELAVGMIAVPNQKPGYVLSMDVTDRAEKVEDYLKRLDAKLLKTGTKKQLLNYQGQQVTMYTFPDQSQATKSDGSKQTGLFADRNAYLLLKDKHLLVADQLYLIQLISDRMSNPAGQSLADVDDYQKTMKRCLDDLPKESDPILRWYIEPLNYGESVRVLMRGPLAEKRRNKTSIFTTLKEQGFDAIRGIGGVVCFKTEGKETVHRTFIYTKKPYRLAMQMLAFPDKTAFACPKWMPSDLARCTLIYIDPIAVFDNFGTLFDSLVMQGQKGVWVDILKGLKEDETGPQIDLRNELIVHLGQRVLGMTKYAVPITPKSESIVYAVELKEGREQAMVQALQKLFGNDPEMQTKKHGKYVLWMRVPAEDVIEPYSQTGSGVADLVSSKKSKTKKEDEEEKDAPPIFPDGAITVANGCLFVSTNGDYLAEILDRIDAGKDSIEDNPEYKEVNQVFSGLGITEKPHFLQFFARTDETFRPTYELLKQGRMPQSQAILGKAINLLFIPPDENGNPGLRQQAFDGSKLPEFDAVRHFFGPSGLFGVSEENGYFIKGFILPKKDPKHAEKSPEPTKKEPKVVEPEKVEPIKTELKLDAPKSDAEKPVLVPQKKI